MPTVQEFSLEPSTVSPGSEIEIVAGIHDPTGRVKTALALVREHPQAKWMLKKGDSDGKWRYAFTIPPNAPAGEYNMDLYLSDQDDLPIMGKAPAEGGDPKPLKATATFTISGRSGRR